MTPSRNIFLTTIKMIFNVWWFTGLPFLCLEHNTVKPKPTKPWVLAVLIPVLIAASTSFICFTSRNVSVTFFAIIAQLALIYVQNLVLVAVFSRNRAQIARFLNLYVANNLHTYQNRRIFTWFVLFLASNLLVLMVIVAGACATFCKRLNGAVYVLSFYFGFLYAFNGELFILFLLSHLLGVYSVFIQQLNEHFPVKNLEVFQLYFALKTTVKSVLSIFKFYILVKICTDFVLSISILYLFIFVTNAFPNLSSTGLFVSTVFTVIVFLWFEIGLAFYVGEISKKDLELIDVFNRNKSKFSASLFKKLHLDNCLNCTVFGVFTLNYSLITELAVGLVSYIIYIVQFNSSIK